MKLDNLDNETFFCDRDLQIGINVRKFYKSLKAVVQNDVLGLTITKDSWISGDRSV